MHWRTPFPPKRPSVLAELIAVVRQSLHPDTALAPSEAGEPLPDELEPAADAAPVVAFANDRLIPGA